MSIFPDIQETTLTIPFTPYIASAIEIWSATIAQFHQANLSRLSLFK